MICLMPSILDRAYASILYRSDQIPPRPNVLPHEQSLPTPQPPTSSVMKFENSMKRVILFNDCMSVNIPFCTGNSSLETSGHVDVTYRYCPISRNILPI